MEVVGSFGEKIFTFHLKETTKTANSHLKNPSDIVWKSVINQADDADRLTVGHVTADHVFPCVKFIKIDTDLDYSEKTNSICQFVILKCNLQQEIDKQEWWVKNRKYVASAVVRLQNDRRTSFRWEFFGEFPSDRSRPFMF